MKRNWIPLIVAATMATSSIASAQFPQAPRPPQQPPQVQQQRSQISQIEAQAVTQIEALLTPEQQRQYKSARRRGAGIVEGLDAVQDISEDQQADIYEITRKTSQQILNLVQASQRR